jgi:signal transduction histidine kinase/ActR/RegA family two-component response regulator
MVRKDSKKVIVSFFGNIQRDAKGLFQRTHCIFQDITEQKRIEEQLLQAQKMESVGQLAGGVAHDFNNLLTAIIGYGNLIKTEVSQDNLLLSYITQILNSAERATNLTHSLLAFSRRQMVKPKPANVNPIINNMKTFLSRIIGEDIELSLLLTSKDLTVMADSNQIEQVLMNLVTNARDAMPDGGNLTIKTEYRELDNEFIKRHRYVSTGSYAHISVEDAGQGMDEETRERLFDPFFTTKEVGRGTGLGLSMVYGIIKQHNGHIDVQTEHGKGTTFNLYFPLTKPIVGEDIKPEDLSTLKGGTETILVAEDETYVRDFIKEILTGYGYKVIEAIDGEDAMRIFNEHSDTIQLLIFDVIMPKKDGKVVYEEIKKVSPHIKVIFISGYATDILHKKGIIEEGINFISKPMSPDELLIKVREALDS